MAGAAVAGTAVLWRTWLLDHPNFNEWLKEKLGPVGKALLCGSCFTYWITLVFILICNPIAFWTSFVPNFSSPWLFGFIINTFLQWMALSWLSIFLRFSYVAIQELVHYQMHHLRDDHKH